VKGLTARCGNVIGEWDRRWSTVVDLGKAGAAVKVRTAGTWGCRDGFSDIAKIFQSAIGALRDGSPLWSLGDGCESVGADFNAE
jgi:hypothetical protein